jgi:hypothetical protein
MTLKLTGRHALQRFRALAEKLEMIPPGQPIEKLKKNAGWNVLRMVEQSADQDHKQLVAWQSDLAYPKFCGRISEHKNSDVVTPLGSEILTKAILRAPRLNLPRAKKLEQQEPARQAYKQ